MSRFYFHMSRRGLALQLFGFYILLGRFGNVHNPCIHIEFPFNSGWRGRLLVIAFRSSIGTETTIHIRYGQKGSTTYQAAHRCWRIDVDSDHYAHGHAYRRQAPAASPSTKSSGRTSTAARWKPACSVSRTATCSSNPNTALVRSNAC